MYFQGLFNVLNIEAAMCKILWDLPNIHTEKFSLLKSGIISVPESQRLSWLRISLWKRRERKTFSFDGYDELCRWYWFGQCSVWWEKRSTLVLIYFVNWSKKPSNIILKKSWIIKTHEKLGQTILLHIIDDNKWKTNATGHRLYLSQCCNWK